MPKTGHPRSLWMFPEIERFQLKFPSQLVTLVQTIRMCFLTLSSSSILGMPSLRNQLYLLKHDCFLGKGGSEVPCQYFFRIEFSKCYVNCYEYSSIIEKAFNNLSRLFLLLNIKNGVLLEEQEMFQHLEYIQISSVEGLKVYKKL